MGKYGRGGQASRSVTLKVAPVQASLRCRTAERGAKRGREEREGMIDRREMRGSSKKREREGGERLVYFIVHTAAQVSTTPSRLFALPYGREPDLSGSP